jgi:hypothetical protein
MKYVSTLILILLQTLQSQSQSFAWEKMQKESEGGMAEDIVAVGNRILMSSYNELFESLDGGAHWSYVLKNKALAVGYGSANSSYGSDKKIIVFGDSIFFGNQFSPNGGSTWQTWSVNGSTLPTWYYSPTVMNIRGKNLYLGTFYNGFYQSSDFGQTFVAKNSGLKTYGNIYDTPMVIEFFNNQPVIATATGIFRWNGNTWINHTGSGLPLTIINGSPGYLVDRLRFLNSMWIASTNQGVYFTNNLGTTWQRFTSIPVITGLKAWDLYSVPAVFYNLDVWNGIIFACYESDIYISTDAGLTWKHSVLPDKVISKRIIVAGNDFLIATAAGVYKSSDGGATWNKNNVGFERTSYYTMVSLEGEGFLASYGNGILKASNSGETLTSFNTGFSLNNVSLNATGNSDVLATLSRYFSYAGAGRALDYKFYHSTTAAPAWTEMTNLPVNQVTSAQISKGGAYFITGIPFVGGAQKGLYLSENKSVSWTNIFNGITQNQLQEDVVLNSFADGDTIYAATAFSGIYRSANKGTTWMPLNSGFNLAVGKSELSDTTKLWEFHSIKKKDKHMYCITTNNQDMRWLYHSSDWGKHWSKIDFPGLDASITNRYVASITITTAGFILANIYTNNAFTSSAIVISRDNGNTWATYNPGFPEAIVNSFEVIGSYLYASGYKGLYRIPAEDIILSIADEERDEDRSPLVYPNPFGQKLFVKVHAEKESTGNISIKTLSGLTAKSMIIKITAGVNKFDIDTGDLTESMYLLELRVDQKVYPFRIVHK